MSTARAHLVATLALAALVAGELALHAAHVARAPTRVALGLLAVAGFAGVVVFHMKLRAERRWVRILFTSPLGLPILYAVTLVADVWTRGIRP
ncbi:MAG: hypothetical protein JWN44_6801 [Myxococcales bacterium]|nr:hypothetical protein [Myxococcales bacterium]